MHILSFVNFVVLRTEFEENCQNYVFRIFTNVCTMSRCIFEEFLHFVYNSTCRGTVVANIAIFTVWWEYPVQNGRSRGHLFFFEPRPRRLRMLNFIPAIPTAHPAASARPPPPRSACSVWRRTWALPLCCSSVCAPRSLRSRPCPIFGEYRCALRLLV